MSPSDGPGLFSTGEVLLGRYRVGEQIAEGGHSIVFRAEDERLRRPACVKLLRFPTTDPGFRAVIEERFVKEAFLLARLVHPATVKIFDFGYFRGSSPGSDGGETPFQVTELVPGGPLSRWVKKRGRLSPREVLKLLAPIARALAEVHSAHVAHLDLKPQNILLARGAAGREAKLADFGIAETIGRQPTPDVRSVLLYSVNWAAPEQMVGDPIGPASDVYALALVVVFALTGRLVFSERDPASAYRLRKASADALLDALSGVMLPDTLVDLFARAIHFEPRLRLHDVMEFFQQIERIMLSVDEAPVPTPVAIEESGPSPAETPVSAVDASLPDRVTAASLWQLGPDKPCPSIAGRQVRFVVVGDSVDLEDAEHIRLRVSFVGGPGESAGLHVKGLNCFVAVAGRRPSSALTLDESATLEFISGGGELLGRAEALFAAAGPSRAVVSVARQSLVVSTEECRHLVALDFGAGQTCVLLCERV
jgi:serine/threonine protein kinase